ncbi:MAG: DUF1203 domain-containing protein [Nocardioidaceae bacterium]
MSTFRLHTVPRTVVDAARASGTDQAGNDVARVTADGGEPLRCCLRDARPGESLILFGHRPEIPAGPYVETGPVFAHASECAGPEHLDRYPDGWRGRPQVLRAYDARGWIHPASTQHDGTDPERAIAAVLDQPGVVQVHSRNVVYGCYMFTVTRDGQD